MQLQVLYNMDLWLIVVLLLILLMVAAFAGKYCGSFRRCRQEKIDDLSNFVPTTILGLMALVLGFTFSMAVAHFESRRALLVEETNALGTAYLRTDFLPQNTKNEIHNLIKQYVDLRIEILEFKEDPNEVKRLRDKTRALQNKMWAALAPLTEKYRDPIMALSINSMNSVFDVEAQRTSFIEHRIPELVYILLFVIGASGVASLGFLEGLRGDRSVFNICVLSLLFALVIGLIMDIDRPRRGLIKNNQDALVQFKESL